MAKIGGNKSTLRLGDHNSIDDIDGQKYKHSTMQKNWKNQLVNKTNFEVKQPQLTLRPKKERISVTDTRTQGPDLPLLDPPITASDLI